MKRNTLWILVAVLVLILLALLAVAFLGQDEQEQTPTSTPTSTPTVPTTQTEPTAIQTAPPTTQPTTAPTTVPTTAPEEEDVLMPMGQLYITIGTDITETYQEATASAQWEGGSLEEQPITVRIRGYSSTWTKKKAYNIKFTEKVGLFQMDAGKKWCLISNAYDKTLLRNAIAMEYAETLGLSYVSSARFCKVYVNGTYIGVYLAMEPVSEGKDRVDIDLSVGDFLIERSRKREEDGVTYLTTNGGLRFEMNEPETPEPAALTAILEKLNGAEAAVQTLDHTVYEEFIDVESFVNFYLFHELFKDIDFAQYSTRYYMKDDVLYAGPPWDLDLSMGNVNANSQEWKYWNYHNQDESTDMSGDSTRAFWAQKDFYMWLWQDSWFRQQVVDRWAEVRGLTENLYAENELGISRLDAYAQVYQQDFETNYTEAGWPLGWAAGNLENKRPAKTWEGNLEILRDWLQRRAAWLDSVWLTEE